VKLEITVTEVKEIFKSLHDRPEQFFEMMRLDIPQAVTAYLDTVMRAEMTAWLGRERYQRTEGAVNHRNGSYPRRFTIKGIGDVGLLVPRDRRGEFQSRVLPRYRRYEHEISRDLSLLFLCGVSTRSLSAISLRLVGRKISPAEVSEANKELVEAVEKWRMRDLSVEAIQYLFIEGVNFRMRIQRRVEIVPCSWPLVSPRRGRSWSWGFRPETRNRLPAGGSTSGISRCGDSTAVRSRWALWMD
jgi:putative transposase